MPCKHIIEALKPGGKATCFEQSTVAKEKGKEFRIVTEKRVCKIKNDDCLDKGEDSKCDYIFHIKEGDHLLLVELKGGDVNHACDQIIGTYKKLKSTLSPKIYQYKGFIVSSGVPGEADRNFRKRKEGAKRDHNLMIEKKTKSHEHRM